MLLILKTVVRSIIQRYFQLVCMPMSKSFSLGHVEKGMTITLMELQMHTMIQQKSVTMDTRGQTSKSKQWLLAITLRHSL